MQKPARKIKHPRILAGSITAISVIFLAVAVLLTINNGVLATMAAFISGNSDVISEPSSDTESQPSDLPDESSIPGDEDPIDNEDPIDQDILFARPDMMKGVWLKAGIDYYISKTESGETVKSQIDEAFAKIAQWGFNTVIVPVSLDGRPLYISEGDGNSISIKNEDGTDLDPPAYILECAKERGIYTYGVIDFRVNAKDGFDPSTKEGAAAIHKMTAEAAARYSFDGWMLDNTGYAAGGGGSYASYMSVMPGGGFERFQRESITAAVIDAVKAIKDINVNLYVGLLADGVWAHSVSDERGSKTNGVYESLTDGFADTRAWVEDGIFDFVMVKNHYSTLDASAPFGKVLEWWAALCKETDIPLYISHDSEKACSTQPGWKSPDQLTQQVLACKNTDEWKGSSFTSFAALNKNALGSTTALLKAFGGTINEQYISRKMVFNTPSKTTLTTYESKINIRGSADPNFALTLNGKEVQLSQHGFFSLDFDLVLGLNTFTFSHKGETITYKITHKVVVLKSIQPTSSMSLDGGTTIAINAVAYKGSNVYAKLGNHTINMKPVATQTDEGHGSEVESDYVSYSGEYTLPAGIINKTQKIGSIVVYGSYKGMNESKSGGTITVKALPIPEPSDNDPIFIGDDSPIDPGNGDKVLKTGKIITVTKSYAETFHGGLTDDWSRPNNAYLPKGTTDVIVKSVVGQYSYYLLGCGRRVYQSDVAVYKTNGKITASKLTAKSVEVNTKATNITLEADWHIPYNILQLPQKYSSETSPNYKISSYTATYIDIVFSYISDVGSAPDVSSSPLFSSSEWIDSNNDSYTLRLQLRTTGAFYGYSARWDNNKLLFSFRNPTQAVSGSKPLLGKRIVIDPGHGGRLSGTAGGNVSEKKMNLIYGLLLRDKLTALGATVVMTRTDDTCPDDLMNPPSLFARTTFARNNYTDLFISIHMDGAGSSARGYSIFYFNEYSQLLASSIESYVKKAYNESGGVSNRYETIKWSTFEVMRIHDCPAILLECGFMTNKDDLEMIISSEYQDKLTTELANGFVNYFNSRPGTTAASTTTQSTPQTTTTVAAAIVPAELVAFARGRKKRRPVR